MPRVGSVRYVGTSGVACPAYSSESSSTVRPALMSGKLHISHGQPVARLARKPQRPFAHPAGTVLPTLWYSMPATTMSGRPLGRCARYRWMRSPCCEYSGAHRKCTPTGSSVHLFVHHWISNDIGMSSIKVRYLAAVIQRQCAHETIFTATPGGRRKQNSPGIETRH